MTDDLLTTTARLRLRRFTPTDGASLHALDSDPVVMRYLTGGAATPRDVIEREILPRFMEHDGQDLPFGFWAAEKLKDGEFIGWFSLRMVDDAPATAALGYRLRQAAWGQGYATEGVLALVDLAFRKLGLTCVTATTYEENVASRRVMEKAGMRLVRRFRLTPADVAAADTYAGDPTDLWDGDDVEYALEIDDWQRRQL